jgi:broad specificity phosphatase PhoE
LAEALHVRAKVHLGDDVDGLIAELKSSHQDERVLIVGHWSSIPLILEALGAPSGITIERSEFDNLFVVLPQGEAKPTLLHLHY